MLNLASQVFFHSHGRTIYSFIFLYILSTFILSIANFQYSCTYASSSSNLESSFVSSQKGFTLEEDWQRIWRRLKDRKGKPNPQGDLLQEFSNKETAEYPMDLLISHFPIRFENAWRLQDAGARLFVQSTDAHNLATIIQIKDQAFLSSSQTNLVKLNYYQKQDYQNDSQFLHIDFIFNKLFNSKFYGGISFYPRIEKLDSDLELFLGYNNPDAFDIQLKATALDPYTNASMKVIDLKDQVPDEDIHQVEWPMAYSLQFLSQEFQGAKLEAYLGYLSKSHTKFKYINNPNNNHQTAQNGFLKGIMFQWHPTLGANSLQTWIIGISYLESEFNKSYTFDYDPSLYKEGDDIPQNKKSDEVNTETKIFLLGEITRNLSLEMQVLWNKRSWENQNEILSSNEKDDSFKYSDYYKYYSIRSTWMPSKHAGVELGFLRIDRESNGDIFIDSGNNQNDRLLTRAVLYFSKQVWCSLGVGWDLEKGEGVFDGGGLTMIMVF